jgi:thiamine biosynthesis protein ThiS
MTVIVNGEPRTLSDHAPVSELLRDLGLTKAACAVEVNKALVPKARHTEHMLAEGDRVEVVTLVGGG